MIPAPDMIAPKNLKVTFLWHQSLLDQTALAVPDVLDTDEYQRLFGIARSKRTEPLMLPWPPDDKHRFWELYLGQWRTLREVKAREARYALVPLRVAAPLDLACEDGDTRVRNEGFLHPWGATFLITVEMPAGWASLGELAGQLLAMRRDKRLRLGGQPEGLSLEDAATKGLEALRGPARGAVPGPRTEAFSVVTLLAAEGAMADCDPAAEGTGAARFLQAVTAFSPTWELDAPRPLEQARVAGISDAPASHLVYGIRRARAIWGPAYFLLPPQQRTRRLSCHHRNLVLASMQTEALARFVEGTAARLGAGTALSAEHRSKAKWAVGILEKLYRGTPDTYRSRSLTAQINQNQLLNPINAVRADQGLAPIAADPWPAQPSG